MTHPDPLSPATSSGNRATVPGRPRGRRGFTLIELLVVLSIVGLLVALLLPAVQGAREGAGRTRCANNLRQMGLALAGYHDSLGSLPMGYVAWANPDPYATAPGWGWATMLLPHLEQGAVYASANVS